MFRPYQYVFLLRDWVVELTNRRVKDEWQYHADLGGKSSYLFCSGCILIDSALPETTTKSGLFSKIYRGSFGMIYKIRTI
jgi:hypothetical protein